MSRIKQLFFIFLVLKNTNAQAILNLFPDHDITGYIKSVPFIVSFQILTFHSNIETSYRKSELLLLQNPSSQQEWHYKLPWSSSLWKQLMIQGAPNNPPSETTSGLA